MSKTNKAINSDTLKLRKNTTQLIKEKTNLDKKKIYENINKMLIVTLLGLIVGGTIGFFTLPVIGIPIGAILGGCSPFLTLIIIGLVRLFTVKSPAVPAIASMSLPVEPNIYANKFGKKISHQQVPENAPTFTPCLFKGARTCQSEMTPLIDSEQEYTALETLPLNNQARI